MKKSRLYGLVCACVISSISLSAFAVGVPGQGTWETTLEARDFDGDTSTIEGYYDSVLGITWLANASAMCGADWVPSDGACWLEWSPSTAWAAGLDFGNGIDNWRLPHTIDVNNDGATYTNYYQGVDYGYNITTHSELSHMFYVTLGNIARYDTNGNETGCYTPPEYRFCLTNTGPFSNLDYRYTFAFWSDTEYAPDPDADAWAFVTADGFQGKIFKQDHDCCYGWAVHDGDVGEAVIPVPPAIWLFGSGLLGLIGISRRKKAA